MAVSKPSSTDPVYTPGTARGAKLAALLVDEGTSLVRKILENEIQKMNPPSLREQLKKHERHLRGLRNLIPGQKKTLYPPSGDVPDTAQGFALSLLEFLLRELVRSELGRDAPYSGERDRLRRFRNDNYGHIPSTDLSEKDFKRLWAELTEILVALGGDRDRISARLNSSIDLERLYKEDIEVKDLLQVQGEGLRKGQEELTAQRESLRQGQDRLKSLLEEFHDSDTVETVEDLIRNNYTFLRKRLQVEKVIPHFIERGLLDFPEDKQVIMGKTTAPGKAEALLELLTQKGTCTPEVFLEILKKGDHQHVADQLKTTRMRHKTTKVDVQEYIDDVIAKVSHKWDDLARKLGFTANEIKVIQDSKPDQNRRCREMLESWRNRKGSEATLQVLKQALIDIGERLTAERLEERTTASLELRTPEMVRLYAEACRQGSLPVHSTRVPVVGQYRSGKSCFIKRLMGQTVIDDPENEEPITDGIHIITDVQTKGKAWKKSKEEIDDLAGPLLQTQQETEPSAEDESKKVDTMETQEASKDTVEADPAEQEKGRVSQGEKAQSTATTEKPEKVEYDPYESLIPEHVAENAVRMIKAGITEDEIGTAEHPRLSFWDFGGQATYYGTHHCFITHRGVYILVMSLEQKLSDPVPDLDNKASVDNLRTGGDYLDHWLNTVHSHTQPHTGRPPVIIVLTRKDKVSEEYIEKYKEEIRSHIKGKAAERLVMPEIFAVDNTTEDAAVDEIRDYIRDVASGLPHMGEEIPIPWLHLNSKLTTKRKAGDRFCRFQEIADLARDPNINITDKHTLALVLIFLHDRGDVIFFNEPSLSDDVALQPQVMIDVFKTIITVPEYQQDRQTDPEVRKMWERLEREGVISDKLLTRIWEKKDQVEKEKGKKPFLLRHKSFLKALMEKYYLLCNATPVGDARDEAQQEEIYFVPALLSCERDNAKLYPANMYICPQALYFVFREKFLPSGMFSRLQALCVRRFGLRESCVFAGCARFPTDDEEQAFVITKVNHYLKVELLSSSNVLTEGLRVRKFLSSALFEIKEKWIPCIQYELCCATREDGGEPDFLALPTEYRSLEHLWGIPSVFRAVWMHGDLQYDRRENSGGDGPVLLQPTEDPDIIDGMRTIGAVLDIMEQGGGLTLEQCDYIRNQSIPAERVKDLVKLVENRYQLGAAVEMCCPEFVDLFFREKRGKELVILHTDDCTAEFVLPLQKAASDAGVPCRTETVTPSDTITVKTVELLLDTNNRMVLLVISPLHQKHWSNLDYEFAVRNNKLLLPILLDPQNGSRKSMDQVLRQRSPVLYNQEHEELQMGGGTVSDEKLQGIVHSAVFGGIFSPLDEAAFKSLSRVWSARTGVKESQGIDKPPDLMRAMAKNGDITPDDIGMLEKDMIAAGISFPVIVRDIPVPEKSSPYQRSAKASVGPMGGEVEISGFVKLTVPPSVLQNDTTISVSTVDIPSILRGPGGVNWISGYPWSLGKNACPRKLLEQVLFSPALHVNLHGAQLIGPVELQTWRPPGSEGMGCFLLKHHVGEGWTDITASTLHHVDSDKISVCLSAFCTLCFAWAPEDKFEAVKRAMAKALSSRTLDCRFEGYIMPREEGVEFHVVCRDKGVETDEYRHGFSKCGTNDADVYLYHEDKIKVAVSADGGYEKSREVQLREDHCRRAEGQNVIQMRVFRSSGKPVSGDVDVTKFAESVCQFSFWEKGDIPSSRYKRNLSYAAEGSDSGLSTPTEPAVREREVPKRKAIRQSDDGAGPSGVGRDSGTKGDGTRMKRSSRKRPRDNASPPPPVVRTKRLKGSKARQTDNGTGPGRIRTFSRADDDSDSGDSDTEDSDGEVQESKMGSGRNPVVLMLNDEYGTSKGGISTIHRGMARLLVSKGAKVYSTVLQADDKDKADAAADGVELIFPNTSKGDDRKPNLNWLTFDHQSRYPNSKLPSHLDFIVGHVNITSRAARMIKKERLPDVKLVQVTHVIPEDVARYKSEKKELGIGDKRDSILADLKDADVIVSVGPLLYDYYKKDTRRDEKDGHLQFLPEPSDIFKNTSRKYVDAERKEVLTVGRVKGVEMLKGYDLLAKAMGKVLEHLPDTTLRNRGITPEDFTNSKAIINANKGKFEFVPFTPLRYGTQEDLSKDMKTADVVLMPSRAEPFGLVGLEAIAAGVPVLVSHKSGLAKFLKTQGFEFDRMIVEIEDDDDAAAQTLAKRIIQILKESRREFEIAQSLKEKLLASNYWAESHRTFLDIFRL